MHDNDVSADSWPSGARPLSRAMQYDSAYHLKRVDYAHGGDLHESPYRAEAAIGDRRPVAERRSEYRAAHQDFTTDAFGNVSASDDDAAMRFDRSLGAVWNGTGLDGVPRGPNQLIDAEGMHATYDAAGNLVELTVARTYCWGEMPDCSHRFTYEWDETGQMSRARRWDFPATGEVPAFDPNVLPVWDLSYAYSEAGRARTTKKDAFGTERHTLDVFGSLRLVHVEFDPGLVDYDVRPENEVGFLGGGLARVFFDREFLLPMAGDTPLHVYLNIGDHLGSTAFVIDKESGEVVERTQHQPYGALESDYRPDRWAASRESYKFTGKEEDIEVGVTYFAARYYNARLGRWMSPDPLTIHGLGADLNPYAYVGGRVMSHVDPLGLNACGDDTRDCVVVNGDKRTRADRLAQDENKVAGVYVPPASAQLIDAVKVQAVLRQIPTALNSANMAKVVKGRRPRPHGTALDYAAGVWNEMDVTFAGPMSAVMRLLRVAPRDSELYDWGRATPTAATIVVLPLMGPRASLLRTKCFAAGTSVLMADGTTKVIEEIRDGDVVLANDPLDSQGPQPRKVTQVHRTATYRLFHIEVEAGVGTGGEVLATASHPFWTARGWVTAEELTSADSLEDDQGRSIRIRAIAVESRDARTFNLSIEGSHTYFVLAGSTPVLVHNTDPSEIWFSQGNHGATFSNGPWAGRSLAEAAAEARALGALPEGLTLNATRMGDGRWVALNNRTLAVARMANLPNVPITEAGPAGDNQLFKALAESGGPIENAVMRCP